MWGFLATDFIDCETFDMAAIQILEQWMKVAAQVAADFHVAPKLSCCYVSAFK
jgi:hypothetical protein